ncbi:MAG: hypothetical protein HY601_03775 [Candidatus Omnitrophica bacterium]|nr:hypothetical protein [Candidatus Omnitrophota bacterium]
MDYLPRHHLDRALRRLGRAALLDRLHALRALSDVRGMRYLDDRGRARTITMALKPWLLTTRQLWFFHQAMRRLVDALLVLPGLYAEHPQVRRVIRFSPQREEWLRLAQHRRSRPLAAIGRLDSTALYDHAGWRSAFRMLEPNAVGVGGVHYAPTGSGILLDVLGDVLTRLLPGRAVTPVPDPRQLLLEELRDVARRLGRPLRGVALIENTDFTTGTDEFGQLAAHLRRLGLRAVVADPRELRLARGQLLAKGEPVDLLYRDSELAEFVAMESRGRRLTALRQAVREGRLISGLTWEFDQKSAWEIFTDPRFAQAFSPAQRAFFRRHVLWTRLVREDRVTDASGRWVDLPPYIRRHRARLVLKPNTLFGGQGVVLGATVTQRVWERHLARALHGRERYVVQALAPVARDTVPYLDGGRARYEERATVSGFYFSSRGISLVGRFSAQPVVNVSQGGGLIAALWLHG